MERLLFAEMDAVTASSSMKPLGPASASILALTALASPPELLKADVVGPNWREP
jgi:hypothetical protein